MFSKSCLTLWLFSFNLCVSITLASLLLSDPENRDKDDAVFVLGKWFYKNGKSSIPASPSAIEPEWFEQCMDHFNSSGCQTKWRQRYWVKDQFYKEGGPIFFQFGGEGSADGYIDAFYWHTYAEHYNALMIVLEHRFYGESWPSRQNTEEIRQLLTSQQALADAAYFINRFSEDRSLNNSEWVAFGGSYAANLAAWLKQKYPNLVKTAVASSGPLLAEYDFPGYTETVSEVVKAVDRECYDRVHEAFSCMESLVNGSSCGEYSAPADMLPSLQQCYSVDFGDVLDRETFFLIIGFDKWADNWPSAGIRRNCAIIKTKRGSGGNCQVKARSNPAANKITTQEEFLNFIHSEEGKMAGAAGWFWQTCYEFGYYMSADPKNGLFGYNTWSGLPYGSSCPFEFGEKFTREYVEDRIALTNEYYKARDIDSKCVIFVNGGWDPWHTLGINDASETTDANTVVHIPGAEHCDDMLNPKSDAIADAQRLIQAQIGIYLNDPNC